MTSSIYQLFKDLLRNYGEQGWWPSKSGDRWEIITGAILTQNTAWTNVEKALANLRSAEVISAEKILAIPEGELQELIRPAGFFKQKCTYLKIMAQFFINNEAKFLKSNDVWDLRNQLLMLKGVGPETADSILLYAFQKPIFVIDAYTRRVAERHLELDAKLSYNKLQKIFMDALPVDIKLYGEYHALILALCKDSCKKTKCGEVCDYLDYRQTRESELDHEI